jgi:hypothetical protein
MKLTPFVALVISMIFTFICLVVLLIHIDLRIKSIERRMEIRGYEIPLDHRPESGEVHI